MNVDFEKFAEPTKEFSKLAVKSLEDIAEIQVKNITECSKLGMESLKSATEITNPEGFKSYMSEQAALTKTMAEGFAADMKTISEIGQNYMAEYKKIFEGSFKV